jgi:hypothetical protein
MTNDFDKLDKLSNKELIALMEDALKIINLQSEIDEIKPDEIKSAADAQKNGYVLDFKKNNEILDELDKKWDDNEIVILSDTEADKVKKIFEKDDMKNIEQSLSDAAEAILKEAGMEIKNMPKTEELTKMISSIEEDDPIKFGDELAERLKLYENKYGKMKTADPLLDALDEIDKYKNFVFEIEEEGDDKFNAKKWDKIVLDGAQKLEDRNKEPSLKMLIDEIDKELNNLAASSPSSSFNNEIDAGIALEKLKNGETEPAKHLKDIYAMNGIAKILNKEFEKNDEDFNKKMIATSNDNLEKLHNIIKQDEELSKFMHGDFDKKKYWAEEFEKNIEEFTSPNLMHEDKNTKQQQDDYSEKLLDMEFNSSKEIEENFKKTLKEMKEKESSEAIDLLKYAVEKLIEKENNAYPDFIKYLNKRVSPETKSKWGNMLYDLQLDINGRDNTTIYESFMKRAWPTTGGGEKFEDFIKRVESLREVKKKVAEENAKNVRVKEYIEERIDDRDKKTNEMKDNQKMHKQQGEDEKESKLNIDPLPQKDAEEIEKQYGKDPTAPSKEEKPSILLPLLLTALGAVLSSSSSAKDVKQKKNRSTNE